MNWIAWMVIAVFLLNHGAYGSLDDDYRLGNNYNPLRYDVHITLDNDFATKKTFTGTTRISVMVNDGNRQMVRLHKAPEMVLTEVWLEQVNLDLNKIQYNKDTEIMEIPLEDAYQEGQSFSLKFVFVGTLYEDMNGFYLSTVDQSDEIIASTQFQPTFARRAFPCFDEPLFKSVFSMSITTPNDYHVLGNQPGQEVPIPRNMKVTEFEDTPTMSTYLLAFVVSNYESKVVSSNLLPMAIWTPRNVVGQADFAAQISYKIIENLSNQLNSGGQNIAFDMMGMKHLDQVAVPDFAAGAMENWGLVTYKQSKLLWSPSESTIWAKEILLRVIAHEFTHNWFGNWITTKWWDTTWLNEGFANYFEYHGLGGVAGAKGFELEKQFVINEMIPIMETDAGASSLPLTSAAYTVPEIRAKFGSITYNKGGSIIRMMRYIDSKNFLKHLNTYLAQHKNEAVEPNDLFEVFGIVNNESFEDVMRNWIEKPGYPVVDVMFTNTEGEYKIITLSQKQFFYSRPEDIVDTTWYVPIWYQVVNDTKGPIFAQLLKPGLNVTLKVFKNATVIINPMRMGYYRVNYDQNLWEDIIQQLWTDHALIDDVTRAQLIDDAMNLARAQQLSYDIAFRLLGYLQYESQYHPWKSAMLSFTYLQKRFSGSDLGNRISAQINQLMGNLWTIYKGFHVDKNMAYSEVYAKVLALQWRCLLENDDCIKEAKELYSGMTTRLGPINANVRNVVYCSALRHSNVSDDWNFLHNKYKESLVANEKEVILTALGCTKDKVLLKNYLELSVNPVEIRKHDGINVFKAVLDGNPESMDVAIEFLNSKFTSIPQTYMTKAISALGDQLRNEHLKQFQEFVETHRVALEENAKVADAAIATAQANIDWTESNKEKLDEYLTADGIDVYKQSSYGLGLVMCTIVTIINHYI